MNGTEIIFAGFKNRASGGSEWLHDFRSKALAVFEEQGFPTTKQELWRFINVSAVAEATFNSNWNPSDLTFDALGEIVLVFENGKLSREKSRIDALPRGVCVGSILDFNDLRFGTLAATQSAFVSANSACFSDGAFIDIADGVELDSPIHLVFLADAEGAAIHLRNFISVDVGSKVTVIEEYVSDQSGKSYWTNAVTEVFVGDGGAVDHYKIQRESAAAYHFQTIEAQVGGHAVFRNHAITLGSALGRNDIRGKMVGEHSEAVCNGLYLLKDKQHVDTHLFMNHAVPDCNSHQLYKGILDDKARAVFCGRILVQKDAQKTDAVQSNRNLLLSRTAKVNTLPQLEIYADDVKCTHGATIGQLDETALYYLQTRGIDRVQGHAMLTFAFANEVLESIQSTAVKNHIEQFVHRWLAEAAV